MMANNTRDRLETLTPSGTYGLYLGFVVVGYVLAYYCYPETSEFIYFSYREKNGWLITCWRCLFHSLEGLSIDEAFSLFDDDFGVKKSVKMRREKAEAQKRYNAEGGESGQVVDYLGAKPETSHIERVEPVASGL